MTLVQPSSSFGTSSMSHGEQYLRSVLARESVDMGPLSPIRAIQAQLEPTLTAWAGNNLNWIAPSGSFAKGTAVRTGTDLDLFISLSPNTPETLTAIYHKLFRQMAGAHFIPRRKNVSIGIKYRGLEVDLVPGRRQNLLTTNHSLFVKRKGTWKMTNVATHVAVVRGSNLLDEIRLFKIWRDQKKLDFPSFYLELTLIAAFGGAPWLYPSIEDRIQRALAYIKDNLHTARVVDPANSNNILSEDLTITEKGRVRLAATKAFASKSWTDFVV